MKPFRYSELSLHLFGVRAGLANIRNNRLRLGWKKSLGKIMQPVNSYTRYPEYHYFFQCIREHLSPATGAGLRALDVGSPKLFGFYLADRLPVALDCTDISPRNIDEYVIMWHGLKDAARGNIDFSIQDVRRLGLEDESYDVVYSMSVIEHVEGERSDGDALREMLRVLKPGGLLLFSVPAGDVHQEQLRPLTGADHVSDAGDRDSFFQHIYSPATVRERLLEPILPDVEERKSVIISRRRDRLLDRYLDLGQDARGFLGWLNPVLSARYNCEPEPGAAGISSRYGERHRSDDIYGDLIYCCTKRSGVS